jgi:hypothetical protein
MRPASARFAIWPFVNSLSIGPSDWLQLFTMIAARPTTAETTVETKDAGKPVHGTQDWPLTPGATLDDLP